MVERVREGYHKVYVYPFDGGRRWGVGAITGFERGSQMVKYTAYSERYRGEYQVELSMVVAAAASGELPYDWGEALDRWFYYHNRMPHELRGIGVLPRVGDGRVQIIGQGEDGDVYIGIYNPTTAFVHRTIAGDVAKRATVFFADFQPTMLPSTSLQSGEPADNYSIPFSFTTWPEGLCGDGNFRRHHPLNQC